MLFFLERISFFYCVRHSVSGQTHAIFTHRKQEAPWRARHLFAENLWGKIARRVFLPAFQGSAFRLHCLRNGSAALPIGARFYLLYVLKTYSLLQTSISMLSVSDFSKQIIGSWFDYAHQPPGNDPVCAKNWGSYAKQPGIRFGRNGKKNLDENPFARSERSERKSYYRRTWLLQTTHWILHPDFSGSGAQN